MKKSILLFLAIIIYAAGVSMAFAQRKNVNSASKQIDTYCKTIDKFKSKSPIVFADTADYAVEGKGSWRQFASEKALDKFREESETYSIYLSWRNDGRIVASNLTMFSPSGDWAKYVYQCFRPDGSLARAESEVRTFNGDYAAIQRLYLDRRGTIIHKSVRFRDLFDNKPLKRDLAWGTERSIFGNADYSTRVSKLPFAHLLKKK